MEEKMNHKPEGLYKVRAFRSCFSEGLNFATSNLLSLCKQMWGSMMCSSVLFVLLAFVVPFVALKFQAVGAQMGLTSLESLLFVASIAWVVLAIGQSIHIGQIARVVRDYAESGNFPTEKMTKILLPEEHSLTMRALGVTAVCVVVLFGALCVELFCVEQLWLSGLLWIFAVAGLLPLITMFGIWFVFENASFVEAIKSLRTPFYNWNSLYALVVIAGGLSVLLGMIVCAPSGVMLLTNYFAREAVQSGDVADVPMLLHVLQIISYLFSGFLLCISTWALQFPLAFLFGSMKKEKMQ